MRLRVIVPAALAAITVSLGCAGTANAASAGHSRDDQPSRLAQLIGRQSLPANDGWAASGTGTSGGAAATADEVFVVHNRGELVNALGGNNATNATNTTPKIIYVSGSVNANVDDANQPVGCDAYADPGYTLDAYLAAYDPAVWGRTSKPSGPLEDARARSAKNQGARININVGSNTTIIGLPGARLTGANLLIQNVDNVIVRNLTLQDAHDCFPVWDPTDGSTGNWNSAYDTLSVIGATHVWVDHCDFSDGNNPDSDQPEYLGRPYQVHDGLLDITKGADLVTASNNYLHDHDKSMLIGSTDSPTYDVGKLRVTLHNNRFANLGQRGPRVRFGQVDIYNNLYDIPNATGPFAADGYSYSWGVGHLSAIYAQNNAIMLGSGVDPSKVVYNWGGTAMTEKGTWIGQGRRFSPASALAAFNAANPTAVIGTDAGWTPTLRTLVLPTAVVPVVVGLTAGTKLLG
ncbi:pectate lyase [Rugosimonospora acidiphila]|uniref:Pectate lyase n=1 Tax=Rugosimonospora acidiphila TaxID=556531 RepID=A0ABP9RWL5_9ACTN